MSGYELQKYYLINLSTRNISISTHLRSENFTLKSGKCIYLGNLTDELVVKYHRYSALNISLRILTKDKIKQIIPKCINATENLMNSLLGTEQLREEHPAGTINDVDVFINSNKTSDKELTEYKKQEQENVVKSSKSVTKETLPTTNASTTHEIKKEETHEQQKQEESKQDEVKNDVLKESIIVNQEDLNNNENENKEVDLTDGLPVEVNVIEESIKQDVKDMSYNQLYDLAKARGLIKKGRPSRDKIIALLTADVENGGQL